MCLTNLHSCRIYEMEAFKIFSIRDEKLYSAFTLGPLGGLPLYEYETSRRIETVKVSDSRPWDNLFYSFEHKEHAIQLANDYGISWSFASLQLIVLPITAINIRYKGDFVFRTLPLKAFPALKHKHVIVHDSPEIRKEFPIISRERSDSYVSRQQDNL